MIRVLVAEDSVTTRDLLVAMLRSDPEIVVVGEARNGAEAVDLTRQLRPDVITMDIQMPLMNGLDATKRIMIEAPTPIVIVSASVDSNQVAISMDALRLGAVAVLAKPGGPASQNFDEQTRDFVTTVKSMAGVKVVRRWEDRTSRIRRAAVRPSRPASVLAIAASTGGPAALQCLLSDLPGDLGVPVLIVQHIAHGFVQGLASWLNSASPLSVKVATDGETLAPNTVYLAPDERHLGVRDRTRLFLSAEPPVGGFRPSGSVLFSSVARTFGPHSVSVILTGMGSDGLEGLRAVREADGFIIAQDEASSAVFGMPAAAIAAGLPNLVLPLSRIAVHLNQIFLREHPSK